MAFHGTKRTTNKTCHPERREATAERSRRTPLQVVTPLASRNFPPLLRTAARRRAVSQVRLRSVQATWHLNTKLPTSPELPPRSRPPMLSFDLPTRLPPSPAPAPQFLNTALRRARSHPVPSPRWRSPAAPRAPAQTEPSREPARFGLSAETLSCPPPALPRSARSAP